VPVAIQAFEAAVEGEFGGGPGRGAPGRGGSLVIAISHEGGTPATNEALAAARAAGAQTALVTVTDRSPAAALADIVVTTGELDTSWCHTVGYVSPILASVAVAGHLASAAPDHAAIVGLMAACLEPARVAGAEAIADALRDADRLVVVGSGSDRPAARELVLKIEEGVHLAASMRDLETLLHGHLAGMDAATGVVLILADRAGGDRRAARGRAVLAACREVGARPAAILGPWAAAALAEDLTPSGRIVVPDGSLLPAPVAAVLGTAIPLQLLTERLARVRGVDPDPIRRDDPAYLRAAETAG
jgi:fructoselysine-6-P-deglycase FrlB-like protein